MHAGAALTTRDNAMSGGAGWVLFCGILVALAVGMTCVAAYHINQLRDLRSAYRRVAKGCGGKATDGGLFFGPKLTFHREGARVEVSSMRSSIGDFITIQADCSRDDQWLTIRSRHWPLFVESAIGDRSVSTGNESFDKRYRVFGNDPAAIRQWLAPPAPAIVDRIRSLGVDDDLHFELRPSSFVVRHFDTYESLVELITLVLALYDHIRTVSNKGISWVEPAPAAKAHLVSLRPRWLCQVCGEGPAADGSTGEVVVCRRCKSPHHRDCWIYNGACSTYGCREKRFLVKRPSKPA
jgi:hypothetical protein